MGESVWRVGRTAADRLMHRRSIKVATSVNRLRKREPHKKWQAVDAEQAAKSSYYIAYSAHSALHVCRLLCTVLRVCVTSKYERFLLQKIAGNKYLIVRRGNKVAHTTNSS